MSEQHQQATKKKNPSAPTQPSQMWSRRGPEPCPSCQDKSCSPGSSQRCSQSSESSCDLSSSSSPPRGNVDNSPQQVTATLPIKGLEQEDEDQPSVGHSTTPQPRKVLCEDDACTHSSELAAELKAVVDKGTLQLLNVWHRLSAPTDNEYVKFMEFVQMDYLVVNCAEDAHKIFSSWMHFRKTMMPPDATPAECAVPFLEQLDDPYKPNPTFNMRAKRKKMALVKVSTIVSALSGTDLVVADAVRDIIEPGRKLRGRAYIVFSSSVAPLKLPVYFQMTLYVLWRMKGGDKVLSAPLIDDMRDGILKFVKERLTELEFWQPSTARSIDPAEVARGRSLSARGDPGKWTKFRCFVDSIVKPHGLSFTSEKAVLHLYKQWLCFSNSWRGSKECVYFKDDQFVLRLTGKVDAVYDEMNCPRYQLTDALQDERPIINAMKGMFLSRYQETKEFRTFAADRRPLGLTKTSICILYVLWAIVLGREYYSGWIRPRKVTLLQRWHEFFGQFKDRDGRVLHDALSPPAESEFPQWCPSRD